MPGYYIKETIIKEDATPIDNVTKFAWADDDYEIVKTWHEYTEEELAEQAENERLEKEQERLKETPQMVNNLNEAVAELGVDVANHEITLDDIMLAVAELGVAIEEVSNA